MGYYSGDRTGYSKGLSHPRPGLNSTPEYQVSGRPWFKTFSLPAAMNSGHGAAPEEAFAGNKVVDDSAAKIEFPHVAKRLVVSNESGADIQVYFCSLMVPVNRAQNADLNEAGDEAPGNPCARGDKLTEAELNAYKDGGTDNRPDSTVKANGHYYVIPDQGKLDINFKCKRVYITGTGADKVSLAAEMTSIENNYVCDLRGIEGISGGSKGTAWGT